jgi:hypothetical protein
MAAYDAGEFAAEHHRAMQRRDWKSNVPPSAHQIVRGWQTGVIAKFTVLLQLVDPEFGLFERAWLDDVVSLPFSSELKMV